MPNDPNLPLRSATLPILLSLCAALFGAGANWLFKRAALQFTDTPVWRNIPLITGLVSFTMVLALFMIAYRLGGRLTVIYPAYATTYVWALAMAVFIDKESISTLQLAGLLAIIAGVALIGIGGRA